MPYACTQGFYSSTSTSTYLAKKQAVLDLRLKRKKYEKSLKWDFLDAVGYQGLACSPQRCFINLQSHVAVTK